MKASELKSEIKDYIYEILSEETLGETIVYGPDSLSKINAIKQLRNNPTYKKLTGKDRTDLENSINRDTDGGVLNLEAKKDKIKEVMKKIKMMEEGDDKKQKVATLKNIIGKLKK